jgi:D-alanyl-D-alanine carboxypeptidase
MHTSRAPRPHAPQVYRLRRAMAATVVIVVAYLGWQVVGGGGEEAAAPTTTSSSTTTTTPPAPECKEGDTVVPQDPKAAWATIIVDTERALPATYGPPDLHNISDAGFPFTDGVAVRSFVIPDLKRLREGAASNGTPIKILAAYRSYPTQVDLFGRRVDQLGATEAGSRVARPGHSEHQLGTTIDITDEGANDVDQSWVSSRAYQWIASHAADYGFILSYPQGAQETTCYDFEPWHLRYVGPEEAKAVIASGKTLREFLFDLDRSGGALPATTTTSTNKP